MSVLKLKDRIVSYHDSCDYKLLNKVPVIIVINGRNFAKATELLNKPYCDKFSECILSTTLKLCTEVEGVIFAYQHGDEIILTLRNDQSLDTAAWLDNKIQKICSITASIATLHFNNCANAIDLNLASEPTFTSQAFMVPNITEAINTMVYKQQYNFYNSIQFACFYELIKKYNKDTIKAMLSGLTIDEKIELLKQECDIDFNSYPMSFRRGSAFYKVAKLNNDGTLKNKWTMDVEPPIFTRDHDFLAKIIK
jgi:tRNA(His) 5'-end guanylyltransferase